jgi:hypothetical protein
VRVSQQQGSTAFQYCRCALYNCHQHIIAAPPCADSAPPAAWCSVPCQPHTSTQRKVLTALLPPPPPPPSQGGQLTPIDLIVEERFHRAAPGGMGGTKAAGNYSPVLVTQLEAKAKG